MLASELSGERSKSRLSFSLSFFSIRNKRKKRVGEADVLVISVLCHDGLLTAPIKKRKGEEERKPVTALISMKANNTEVKRSARSRDGLNLRGRRRKRDAVTIQILTFSRQERGEEV